MRLTSEVQVVSRLCPTLNIKTSAKAVRCQLAIGKKPASADKTIFIMISTTQNLSGHFYKIHENIEAIHCKFINEGKASIRVKQPAMDIMISKAESSQLKKFVQLIKIVVMQGSLSDGEAPSQLSTLTPVTGKALNNVKVKKIFGRENYPIAEGFPSGLTHLQISYCRLGKLDSRILGLRDLTQLDLSNNKLTFVPHELRELPLTLLNLSKNNICNFSEDFCKESTLSSSLQTLNLEDNPKLSRLPVTLHNLSRLHTLNVSRCSLTRLPSMIGFIRSLCFLYIADNKIKTLPHSFLRLRLDQLQASGNEFIAPTDVVESRFQSPVPTLEELAARALRLHNVAVTRTQVFPDMWQYLNSAKRHGAMSSHLRQLFYITLISIFTSCAEPASPVDHVIVGVFDNETHNLSFHAAVSSSNHTNARSLSYISKHYSHRSLMKELCSLDNILFIYTISTNEVIKLLTIVTSTLNIPLFAYDTTAVSPSQRLSTHELLFYMNSKPADEGTVFAKIARVSVWRQIIFVMHSSMSDDGLLESFKSVFLDSNELYTTKKLIYDSKNESIPSLLFRLNGILLSLQVNHVFSLSFLILDDLSYDLLGNLNYDSLDNLRYDLFCLECFSRHTGIPPDHYVVVLHLPYDIVLEILSDADLLFEKKRIAWLVSSAANILSSTDIKWGVVTLKQETVDDTFVTESMSRILEVVNQYISTRYLVNLPSCNNISSPPSSDWLEYLHESKLVAHHNLDYYRYSIYTSSVDSTWPLIGEMSSTNHKNLSSISKNISTRMFYFDKLENTTKLLKPTTLTVVTIIDKPFVSKNTPLKFEGNPYCLRPAIACLEIPASVIIAHGYSSKVVDLIFEDHAVGRTYTHRSYEMHCCEGLAMDLLQSLADQLDFNYRLYISPDGSFGAYNNVTGNWTGMVKEIMDGRADMVAASFSILSGRAEVIDFTAPYYYSGYTMMASTNETHKNNFFLFLTPFHSVVWTSFLAMATIVACLLAFFEWMSIDGMNRLRVKDARSYTLASSMKTTISLMCGNNLSSKEPQSWVAKWMQNVWGFFGIIFLSAYTANLTSFLADGPSKLVVSGLHDNAVCILIF
ncbi:LRR1 [Bugula neritina]|uniref:LRR1 n=1 Tax=Bugula neritina TaxID=10212 RepID=A0A7J7K9Z0_BUGNE|nr:LRR1 [Bugula neritina]